MAARNERTIIGTEARVFESVLEERNIIIDGASLAPLDVDNPDKYIILAGTPLCPIPSSGKYRPIRRTLVNGTVENDTTVTVDNAKPFAAGDGIRFFASLAATSTLRTISSVNTTTNVIVLTAAATINDNEYFEVSHNGGHGAADAASSTQIPDAALLLHDVQVAFADGSTFDAPAVGVTRGSIRRDKVLAVGPGTTTFDTILKSQLPNIDFLPTSAGTA